MLDKIGQNIQFHVVNEHMKIAPFPLVVQFELNRHSMEV